MKFDAIIFDLGRVLIDFDHRTAADRASKFSSKTAEEIFELFFDSELTELFEKGKISTEEFFNKIKEILGLNLSFEEFLPIWNDIFYITPINQEVHKIAKGLKGALPTLLLSNINILHFEYLKERFPKVFEGLDKLILSYEVGLRKPDPEIYRLAIRSLNTQPKQILYVEDRLELVLAAENLGIAGLHFNGTESLKRLKSELAEFI